MSFSEEEAQKILGADLDLITNAVILAWQDYNSTFSQHVYRIGALSPSVIMHGLMVFYAKDLLAGRVDVEQRSNGWHSTVFSFKRAGVQLEVVIRFKKARAKGRTSNADTVRNQAFELQQQYELPFEGELTRLRRINLNMGYIPDVVWENDNVQFYLSYPNGKSSVEWVTILDAKAAPILQMPSTRPSGEQKVERVWPKEVPKSDQAEEKNKKQSDEIA